MGVSLVECEILDRVVSGLGNGPIICDAIKTDTGRHLRLTKSVAWGLREKAENNYPEGK